MVKKNTKHALLMSVLSLLLCCSMLIGTTFAWFTDTVESGINRITAGNLDVEVYYGKGETPKTNKVEKDTENLFTDAEGKAVLWEPGVVAYTNLNVVNEGSLALKYQFAINFDNENFILGTNAKLSDVLQVAFLDEPVSGNREEILAAAKGQGVLLSSLLKSGKLEAKGNKVYGVVIFWEPSDKDNTWNVQNGAKTNDGQALHIDLGLKLVATQLTSEYDSFGNDYDAMAGGYYHVEYGFNNPADLLAFAPVAGDAASSGLEIKDGKAQINKPGAWYEIEADLSKHEYILSYDIDITNLAVGENVTVDTGEQVGWGSTPIMLERGSTKVYYGNSKNEYLGELEGTVVRVTHTYKYNNDNKLEITTVVSDGEASISYTKAVASAAQTNLYWDIYFATEAGKATMDNFSLKNADAVVDSGAELGAEIAQGGKVVLATDIVAAESIEIPQGVEVELDLNGKTLEATNGAAIRANGNLALTGEGTIKGNVGQYVVRAQAGSTITVNEGIVVEGGFGAIAVPGGTLIVNGGDFSNVEVNASHYVVSVWDNGKVIINGGTFTFAEDQYANANGAPVIGAWGGGSVEINGGTFDAFSGSALCYAGASVVVKGGTFMNAAAKTYGGTVSDKVASGYKAVKNADGSYTVIFPQESFEDLIENAQPGDTVEVPAGNFTMSGNNELVIVGNGEDTVITFTNSIENANISNATISGEPRLAVKSGQNAQFNNVHFEGTKAWGSVQGTASFTGCTFSGLLHIDSSADTTTIKFEDCTFDEYSIIKLGGSADYILEGCTVEKLAADATGAWGKEWLITYCDTTFTDCELGRQVRAGSSINITFNNCVDANDVAVNEKIININPYADPILLIDGVPVVFSNDALKTVINNGATKVMLADGEYDLNGIQKDGLTLIGVGENVKMTNTTKYASGKAIGAIWKTINLENMTITNTVYTMADGGDATFTNVYFAAGFRQGYGKNVVFTDCTFGSNSEGYALHFQTDAASEGGEIKLNGCKFEGGKVHLGGKRAYYFAGCSFAEGTDFQVWSDITLDNCTVNGEKVADGNVETLFPNLDTAKVTFK